MEMKNVQIPYDLFLALLQHHLMMEDGYEDEIRYGLEQKLEAMVKDGIIISFNVSLPIVSGSSVSSLVKVLANFSSVSA